MEKLDVRQDKSKVIVRGIKDFDPVHIFECGQCFRWIKQNDGSFQGVARGKTINVKYNNNILEVDNTTSEEFRDIWYEYFDLGTDYGEIKSILSQKDEIMKSAVEFGHGIRLLKQDFWEVLVSFIVSANNAIPRIMRTVEIISKVYGDKITFNDKEFYTFPSIDKLYGSNIEELEVCKGGFRCKYILGTAQKIMESVVDLKQIKGLTTDEARNELMKLPGVGPKVADCVLLFSGIKYDIFPTDVWVKRVMEELYFKKEVSLRTIQEFSKDYFGGLAGFAQQYLFYYARENKIGAK